tara:strand:- start:14425 stop:15393 length:969 start_codon:yes stop_codon:yes gene_type:complete
MINIYFYKIHITLQCCFYKKNFGNQLINLVNDSIFLNKVNNITEADIIITIGDFVNDICLKNKKLIVYSLQDNCLLNDGLSNNENVLLILDHYKATDVGNIYNVINGNRLKYFLSKHYDKDISFTSLNFINNSYSKKLKCLLNISKLFSIRYQNKVKSLNERRYDLVFLGNTNYDKNITKHRLDTKKMIQKICRKNNLKYFLNYKPIKYTNYVNIISNTKIFVSPYGWGEFSTKDYECICYGTHILKPKIYFEYYPNFCKNMDDFEVDFSNFEEKVLHILNNIDNAQKKVDNNRKMFLEYNEKNHLLELEKIIKEVYSKSKA